MKSTTIRNSVAATIAAAGLAVGGVGLAAADDTTPSSTSSDPRPAGVPVGPGGPERHDFFDGAELADALGVSESRLQDAMDAVREDLAPPTDGTVPDPADMEAQLAKALADELGLSEAKVTAALEKVHAEHEAQERSDLSDRLDDAVDAGDLTAADKASVLKAFDAGVLFGGPAVQRSRD